MSSPPKVNLYTVSGDRNVYTEGTDHSNWVKSVEIAGKVNSIRNLTATLLRESGQNVHTYTLERDHKVAVKISGQELFTGLLDNYRLITPHTGPRLLEVTARGYGRDAANKVFFGAWNSTNWTTELEGPLEFMCSGVIAVSPNQGGAVEWDSRHESFHKKTRDLAEETNRYWYYNFFNNTTGRSDLTVFQPGDASYVISDSDFAVVSRGGSSRNNIVGDYYYEEDSLDEANHIIVEGGEITDGWTEGNASDWSGDNTDDGSNTVSDVTTDGDVVPLGHQALRMEVGTFFIIQNGIDLGDVSTGFSSSPNYHYNYLDYTEINDMIKFHLKVPNNSGGLRPMISLWDTNSKKVSRILSPAPIDDTWMEYTAEIGPDETEMWDDAGSPTGFTWEITKIRIGPEYEPPYASYSEEIVTPGGSENQAGQKDLRVDFDAPTIYSPGDEVIIFDTAYGNPPHVESNTIDAGGVVDNGDGTQTLTMVNNLSYNYTAVTPPSSNSICYLREYSWDYTLLDNLHLPQKRMYGFSGTSDVWVNEKWRVFRNTSLNSQAKIENLAEKLRDRYKYIVKRVHATVDGTIYVRHPGWRVAVDLPDEGVDNSSLNENYDIVEYRHVYNGDSTPVRGYPWVTVLDLVAYETSPETKYVGIERIDGLLNFVPGEMSALEKRIVNSTLYPRKMISGEATIVDYTP
jgi:hypothetical protein